MRLPSVLARCRWARTHAPLTRTHHPSGVFGGLFWGGVYAVFAPGWAILVRLAATYRVKKNAAAGGGIDAQVRKTLSWPRSWDNSSL